jgi:hypothetical protein
VKINTAHHAEIKEKKRERWKERSKDTKMIGDGSSIGETLD